MGELHDRYVVPLLIALVVAGVTLHVFFLGHRGHLPSIRLEIGEVGTAEISVFGIVLYRGTTMGVHREAMGIYREAIWWQETALLVEWGVAAAVGVGVYIFARWWRARSPTSGKHAESGEAAERGVALDTGRK